MVVWIAGGRTTTSITSREPPNSVMFGLVTVVQAAVRPAGITVYDSVWSPTFSTASDSEVDSPGCTEISSWANHTCTDTSATLLPRIDVGLPLSGPGRRCGVA